MPALTAGKTAPDFSLPATDGHDFSMADARKRGPVVLAFFKVSCPVCQFAFPFLERMCREYKGRNVTFVAVSQNSLQDTKAFLKQYGVTFPVALDDSRSYRVSNAYGLTNVPTLFYISPDGKVELSSVGWSRADVAEVNTRLANTLKAPKATVFRPGEDVPELRAG
jgi:peroxiredoxin